MLISYEIHGTICIQCGATGHVKQVQKLFVKWINPRHPIAQTGREAALEPLFGRGGEFAAMPTN